MVKRIALILRRAIEGGIRLPSEIKEFGFKAAMWLWLLKVLPSVKGQRYIKFLTKYMDDFLKPITAGFLTGEYDSELYIPRDHIATGENPVWICWLQGEESMPELVQMCYRQLKKNIPEDAEIHLITLENYFKYITLPDYIIEKFNEGKIGPAHFSDVLRFFLLYAYGGLWVDVTVFTTNVIQKEFFCKEFWTQRAKNKNRYITEPSKAEWCGFFLGGGKYNKLFAFVRNSLLKYWKEYDICIDYIMFDYMILSAYNNVEEIKRHIDNVEYNNENIWEMITLLNERFDEEIYKKITTDTMFFKLTYKMDLKKCTDMGEPTFYKHLIDISNSNRN